MAAQTQKLFGLSILKMEWGKYRANSVYTKRKATTVLKNITCQSNNRGRGKFRRISRKML